MKTVYISLGSNLGDRAANIGQAIDAMAKRGINVAKRSSLYETEPVNAKGGWFLNCVAEVETDMMPRQLLRALLQIEESLGRKRGVAAGKKPGEPSEARAIDIDILLFGTSMMRYPELEIPHPRMADRRFVLVPFAEIAPDMAHPALHKTIAELLEATSDRGQVRPFRG